MKPGRALQVSEGLLYLGRLCDPISSSDPVPLRAERRWQRAPHEGGDSRGLSAEDGPGPGRQPRQRQAWQAEGRVHEDPGPAAGKPGRLGGRAAAPRSLREGLKKKVDVLDQKQIVNNFELVNEILKDGIKIYG